VRSGGSAGGAASAGPGRAGDDGTGLGLATVRAVADARGRAVAARERDGGACVEGRGVAQPAAV